MQEGVMPKNKLIYYGILLVAATALLGLGYYIIDKARPFVYGVAGIGLVMIILGMVMEAQKKKEPEEGKPQNPNV
jgi:hypothetical protein